MAQGEQLKEICPRPQDRRRETLSRVRYFRGKRRAVRVTPTSACQSIPARAFFDLSCFKNRDASVVAWLLRQRVLGVVEVLQVRVGQLGVGHGIVLLQDDDAQIVRVVDRMKDNGELE